MQELDSSSKNRNVFPEYPFKSNYFQIGTNRLHYIDEGQGPVVLLVHGNPTWSYYYRNIVRLLSVKYRVIAIDHMGCGLSDKPQNYSYTLNQHIENLKSLMDHLGLSSFSMIVHDWGGAIGMGVATEYPERVEKIVILNTAAFRSTRIPLRIRLCRMPVIGPIIVRGLNGFAWPATFMAVSKRKLPKDICSAYLAPYDNWRNRIAISGFVQDIPLRPGHQSYERLKSIEERLVLLRDGSIPMLILWGGKDFCFDSVFYQEWLQRFPDAEAHYYEDGGHYILEDKFDEIQLHLRTFFALD